MGKYMPFTDAIKQEVRSKAGYACCLCQLPHISLEIHHIIPQEDGGPDTIDNAVALCPTHHADLGGNREKIKRMKETRDWWYQQVEKKYNPRESTLIQQMSKDLLDPVEGLPDLKEKLKQFIDLRIHEVTALNAPMFVSSIIGTATASASYPHTPLTTLSEEKNRVICVWLIPEKFEENEKILVYEFTPTLQNKGETIIKDFWINFSSSGFNLEIEKAQHTDQLDITTNSQGVNIITKNDYRFAPLHFLYPFKIKITIKKGLIPNDAWLYYSYGAPNAVKVETRVDVTKAQLDNLVLDLNHSTQDFLRLLGLSK